MAYAFDKSVVSISYLMLFTSIAACKGTVESTAATESTPHAPADAETAESHLPKECNLDKKIVTCKTTSTRGPSYRVKLDLDHRTATINQVGVGVIAKVACAGFNGNMPAPGTRNGDLNIDILKCKFFPEGESVFESRKGILFNISCRVDDNNIVDKKPFGAFLSNFLVDPTKTEKREDFDCIPN